MNLDTREGKMYKGAAAYKSAQRIGAARAPQSRKRKMMQQVVPHHKKNISYESYLMNRPVVRRYSNAYEAYTSDDRMLASAVKAAGGLAAGEPQQTDPEAFGDQAGVMDNQGRAGLDPIDYPSPGTNLEGQANPHVLTANQ